ncbi:Phox homologous domain-containing protein [Flammula alnicola]|nr:Phox homologous domain-containing protein [Flammula alnicola]
MTAIQAVFIRGHEERSSPKPHTVYRIDIQAHVRSWQMWRRYSEFDDLHTEMTKAVGVTPPCALPPKHKFALLRSKNDAKLLEERRVGLEAYLRAIVSAKEDKWRETYAFKDFLGVPVGRQGGVEGGAPTQFTSATWLDEHAELQARLRDVWADINKRDALSDRSDVPGAHKSNVAAKSKLAGILARIGTLGRGLQELGLSGMSEGELQRRTDMVARLQDDCEKLGKVVSVARQMSMRPGGSTAPPSSAAPALATDREALLGAASKPARRVFGAPPKETEVTRPLDNVGLVGMQQIQIQQQDNQLSQLTTILQRQRQLGEAIGSEIAIQIEMLGDLSNEVDRVGDKLHTANKQMNKLS